MASKKEVVVDRRLIVIIACIFGFALGAGLSLVRSHCEARVFSESLLQQSKWKKEIREYQKEIEGKKNEAAKYRDELAVAKNAMIALEKKEEELQLALNKMRSDAAQRQDNDRHLVWKPSSERDKKNPELAKLLKEVANENAEVMVAVSNINYAMPGGMLDLWMDAVKQAGVQNAMVVALDDETKQNVEKRGIKSFQMNLKIPESQKDTGSNHAVSALKFRILQQFMDLGYSVLLSDVDIITLQDPFTHLVRDSDVESMSDGWDDQTAYGYNDVFDDASMGWARYAHSMRIFVFNSGLFYIRPTEATKDLLEKLIQRVETENGWDQALFNECIFFPNSPNNKDPSVTRRAMDILKFMNSKVLFKYVRHDQALLRNNKPVMIHVNYHPDKFERMEAIVKYFVKGDTKALDAFPDGSE